MWRRLGFVLLGLLVIGVVAGIIIKQKDGKGIISKGGSKSGEDEETEYFEQARIGDLKIVVEATGTTEPITDIEVKSEATGRITDFFVEEGDRIEAGDVICRLDQRNQQLLVDQQEIVLKQARLRYDEARNATSETTRASLETQLENSRNQLAAARDNLQTQQQSFERIEALYQKDWATQQEYDNARNQLVSLRSSVASAEASLALAEENLRAFDEGSNDNSISLARLSYDSAGVQLAEARKQLGDSEIASPISGIVLEKLLDVGDSVVSINSSFSGGNTIIKVADLSRIKVRTYVDEIDIGKIKVGQNATVEVDAFLEKEFSGKVTNIYPQGVQAGSGLINFVVIIEVDNEEGLLLGNMTASVKIEADVLKDVLLIPLGATRAGEKPDTNIVYRLKEGGDITDSKAETEEIEVRLGDTDYYDIIVLEGLEEGDYVKVRGFETQIQFGG
ncbi:MAG: efflux RND transporter periplasmic adaptor subunit [bacterium]